jgi:hypothetical protein
LLFKTFYDQKYIFKVIQVAEETSFIICKDKSYVVESRLDISWNNNQRADTVRLALEIFSLLK